MQHNSWKPHRPINRSRPKILINHDVLVVDQRMESMLLDVLPGTGLHEGFVEMEVCSDLPKGRLQMKQGVAVRQVTDALVAANPGCQWGQFCACPHLS